MTRISNRPIGEGEFEGGPVEEAPKIAPDHYCNSRQSEKTDDGESVFAGYCSLRSGWGTDHVGEGQCKLHGGSIEGAGAPDHNQNAQTHALDADPYHYYHSLDDEEREFIDGVSATIQDRLRAQSGDVDYMDRVLARRVTIKLHIVSKASDYLENESGLLQSIQTGFGTREEKAPLLTHPLGLVVLVSRKVLRRNYLPMDGLP